MKVLIASNNGERVWLDVTPIASNEELALHRSITEKKPPYTISHTGTGRAVAYAASVSHGVRLLVRLAPLVAGFPDPQSREFAKWRESMEPVIIGAIADTPEEPNGDAGEHGQ